MGTACRSKTPNPLRVPELVDLIIHHVESPSDLLNCACVNETWSMPALRRLYRGSMHDMRYRTPDIGSLNSLWVSSLERFARNMSFVKHLVIAPETLGFDEVSRPEPRLACLERCRPLRDRRSAELLLRPKGEGPVSLAIPFSIADQDLSAVSDLIFHPRFKHLILDLAYCELFSGPFQKAQAPAGSLLKNSGQEKLSSLAALSIRRADSNLGGIKNLCRLLECCDLELFQLEDSQQLDETSHREMVQLLRCLWRHRNLRVLTLTLRFAYGIGEICAKLEEEEETVPWPAMKALYLAELDRYWLEKLPAFRELRILIQRDLEAPLINFTEDAARSISQCQQLRVINVKFDVVDDAEIIIRMARGCPFLQKFHVHVGRRSGEEMTEDQVSRLMQALPHVESLLLENEFQGTSSMLRAIADFCPRLMVLDLSQVRLFLSLNSLAGAPPLERLGALRLLGLRFDIPVRYMRLCRLRQIAREWSRVFPRIRRLPCPADAFGTSIDLEECPSCREKESDVGSGCPEDHCDMALIDSALAFDDNHYDCSALRRRFWRLLDYGTNTEIFDRVCYMWQANLEIKMLGWPVVPMSAFQDPDRHSTTERDQYRIQ